MLSIVFATVLTSFTAYAATTPPSITTSISAFTEWLPIVVLAIIASVGIVMVYYIIGTLLNNRTIKSAALSEFENAIGTALVVVILIAVFELFGSGFYPSLLMSRSNANNLCTTLNGANLNFINGLQQTPTNQICTNLIPSAGNGGNNPNQQQATANLDYGLASTYLVLANLTNQTATNLNGYYIYRGYMSFLSTFNSTDSMCWPALTCVGLSVATGGTGLLGNLAGSVSGSTPAGYGALEVKYTFQPFAGYDILLDSANLLTQQSTLMFYLFILQLMIIIVLLHSWPYILAAGIILRASFLTRKVGGLLIAIAVVGLLVYPAIFLMQYNSLNTVGSQPIGATSLPTLQLIGSQPPPASLSSALASLVSQPSSYTINYDEKLNFFVFPRADYIIYHDGCWPAGGNLITGELQVIGAYGTPLLGLLNGALNLFTNTGQTATSGPSVSSQLLHLGFTCNSYNAINTTFSLYNLYGLMSIIGLIFPLINALLVLAALFSISSLLGGDTRLFGIERLV
jgi:hypothetical protein